MMTNDKRNIDQLFRHNLKDFEDSPPSYAWDRLREGLLISRRRRRVVLYRWIAAAAVFILAFIAGYFYASFKLNDQMLKNNTITQTIPESNMSQPEGLDKTINTSEIPDGLNHSVQNQESGVLQKTVENHNPALAAIIPGKMKEPSVSVKEAETEEKVYNSSGNEMTTVAGLSKLQTKQSLFAESPQEEITIQTGRRGEPLSLKLPGISQQTKEKKFTYDDFAAPNNKPVGNKWIIGGQFSPVYSYRNIHILEENLPSNVIADKNYYNHIESGIYSYAGGINVEYLFKEKISLQTGLYYSRIGQMNQDILAFQYPGDKYSYYANTSTGTLPFRLESLPEKIKATSIRDTSENLLYINSNIYQDFEYLELPLLVKYSILLNHFSLNLTGGLSPGIMVGNHAYFKFEDQHYDLNRSGDFYSMIYNSVVGIGMDYFITKKLKLSLTPTFKYSIQSIRKDQSIEYYPYSLSVFTGINYRF